MDLLVNDLSINGQFQDLLSFRGAIKRVMAMREIARSFGRDIYCHKNITQIQVTPNRMLLQVLNDFSLDERRALLAWLTKNGPFWDEERVHGPEDYLDCQGRIVTDTAVGEAAFCNLHGIERRLISLDPSQWLFSPIRVKWYPRDFENHTVEVHNYWALEGLEALLRESPAPTGTWGALERQARDRFNNIVLAEDAFRPLMGHPFVPGAANRIIVLLDTLNRIRMCFREDGEWNELGNKLFRDHFSGVKHWFSDASQTEKAEFKEAMTFSHPARPVDNLFCPWHGKVKAPQLRIHFSFPIRKEEPTYVVYIGPKITKW